MHYDIDPDDKPEDYPDFWGKPRHPRREEFTLTLAVIVVFTLIALGIKWLWN